MLSILLISITSLCALVYWYLTCNFNYWKKRNVPGPEPKIWTGNIPSVWNSKVHAVYEFGKIYNDYKEHPFAGFFMVRTPKLFVFDPEIIKNVTTKNFKSFMDNEFSDFVHLKSDPLLGRNPFFLKGEDWKKERGNITPAFTASRIRGLSSLMNDVAVKMTMYVKKNEGNPLEAKELAAKYTTDVVSNCVFAVEAGSFDVDVPEIREMGRELFLFSNRFALYLAGSALFSCVSKMFDVAIVPKRINEFFINLMRSAINYRKENKIERNDYLDHLLKLEGQKGISELNLTAAGISFFADGFETSSSVMSFCLYDLAQNKDIQDRLREEINDCIKSGEELNVDTIAALPYLEQVLAESQRLHPILHALIKKCTESIELVGGKDKKVFVEKDMSVVIPYYHIHLDERHYPEPTKFDPERFSPENGGTKMYKDRGVYIPFGDGPRMCLGMRFGVSQVKRGIVEIIKNFEISVNKKTIEPFIIDPEQFLIVPLGGIWLDFKPIN